MEELTTVNEVAGYLGIHKETVYRMCRMKRIPCYKIGKSYYFKMSKIAAWLEGCEQKTLKGRG